MGKSNKKQNEDASKRGVVFLGHIPHGFFEPQIKQFFRQFGQVTRVRLSRSKKTGRSKGYAFVEFQQPEVAKVVADTMNNYLMFTRLVKCQLVPPEKVHPELFKGSEKKFSAPKSAAIAGNRNDSVKTPVQEKRRINRQRKKAQVLSKKLADLGIALPSNTQVCGSPLPDVVATPGGRVHVLQEDADDMEVTFKTPPGTVKSSRLVKPDRNKKRKHQSTPNPQPQATHTRQPDTAFNPKSDTPKKAKAHTKPKSSLSKTLQSKAAQVKPKQRKVKRLKK